MAMLCCICASHPQEAGLPVPHTAPHAQLTHSSLLQLQSTPHNHANALSCQGGAALVHACLLHAQQIAAELPSPEPGPSAAQKAVAESPEP